MGRKKKVIKEKDSVLKWSSVFRKTMSSDSKIRLTSTVKENSVPGYLNLKDLKTLSGGSKWVPIYIPIQYSVSSGNEKKEMKYSWDDKYAYEIQYLKVYILYEDILNYLGFPLSLHKKIINRELSYLRLDDLLSILPKKEEIESRCNNGIATIKDIETRKKREEIQEVLSLMRKKKLKKQEKKKMRAWRMKVNVKIKKNKEKGKETTWSNIKTKYILNKRKASSHCSQNSL